MQKLTENSCRNRRRPAVAWLGVGPLLALALAAGLMAPRPAIAGPGIAAAYPADEGLISHSQVLAATRFDSDNWMEGFRLDNPASDFRIVDRNHGAFGFRPFDGRCMRVEIPANEHYGLSLAYHFADHLRVEPEAIHFRYYLRFADDWSGRGGKLPGIGGTYGRAGWGGKRSDGFNGWSSRGSFGRGPDGKVWVGAYCYHADLDQQYGEVWRWDIHDRGLLEKNRWYCIEQAVKLNDPGVNNGVVHGWVDGELAFEKSDILFRRTDKLRIEKVWLNVYHGGKQPAESDDHLFIDNIVIARHYIGPSKGTK